MSPRSCPHCYKPVRAGAKFCPYCGQPILARPAQPVAPRPPTRNWSQPLLSAVAVVGLASICLSAGVGLPGLFPSPATPRASSPTRTGTPAILVTATAAPQPFPTDGPGPTLTPIIIPGLEIEIPHLSDEEEIDIGRQAAREFEREFAVSTDAALIERVNQIGQTILPFQPRSNIPFTFKVLDTDEINAFALPGGYIYVTRAMLDFVESDDELAGVIGHEIAHVALRHGAQQIEAIAAAQVAVRAALEQNPDFEQIYQDQSTQLAIEVVKIVSFSQWGQQAELDADQYGTIYLMRAGYSSQGILNLFNRLARLESSADDPLARLVATHPPFKDRIVRIEQTIATE